MTSRYNRRWSELSRPQQVAVIGGSIVQIGLQVAELRDLAQRPASEIRGRKWIWAVATFVNFVGPLSYFLFGRRR